MVAVVLVTRVKLLSKAREKPNDVMFTNPLAPYGQALRDFDRGDTSATIIMHSDLGEHDDMPVSIFFREPADFFPFERAALDLCRGRVLDLGAGTGVHSLALQARGFPVTAVETVPEAVEIMRKRGAQDVVQANFLDFEPPVVDTVLMMMNGIGPVGTLDGLDRFLRRAPRFLNSEGQILVDSGAANVREESSDAITIEWPTREGNYIGEAWISLEYRGERGPPFRELYVDSDTLADHTARAGWACEIVLEEGGGYLFRLTRTTAAKEL